MIKDAPQCTSTNPDLLIMLFYSNHLAVHILMYKMHNHHIMDTRSAGNSRTVQDPHAAVVKRFFILSYFLK